MKKEASFLVRCAGSLGGTKVGNWVGNRVGSGVVISNDLSRTEEIVVSGVDTTFKFFLAPMPTLEVLDTCGISGSRGVQVPPNLKRGAESSARRSTDRSTLITLTTSVYE